MKAQTAIALATAMLLGGAVTASAADAASHAATATKPSDSLNLTAAQQKTAWQDLNMPSLDQSGPSGFTPSRGAKLPSDVTAAAMPAKAARDLPALRPYDYAMVQSKVVIVNPNDKTIAEVITG
jgi:hypothetical protein